MSRQTCIMGAAIADNVRLSPEQLRTVVDRVDERATPEELADVAQAYELISNYEHALSLGAYFATGDYNFVARHVLGLEYIGIRAIVTRQRTITAQSERDPRVTYSLRRIDLDRWSCTCPGWQHRGHCKHADAAAGKVTAPKPRKESLRGSLKADHERDTLGGSLAVQASVLESAR